jgi:ATP-dependent DNA ligase
LEQEARVPDGAGLRIRVGVPVARESGGVMSAPQAMACISDVGKFMKDAKTPMNVMWSYKLDGVRVMAEVDVSGTVKYVSRKGKEFANFGKFNDALYEAAKRIVATIPDPTTWDNWPVVFDGEVMPKDGNGDSLAKVMTQLRRLKDIDDSLFAFNVFDLLPSSVDTNELTQFQRYQLISEAIGEDGIGDVTYHRHFFGPELMAGGGAVAALMTHAVKAGYEGIVLKVANAIYDHGKRSSSWCKVKPSDTMDLKVVGYEPGEGKHAGKLGALVCEMPDGQKVRVGTGLDDKEREEFAHALTPIYEDAPREWITNLPAMIEVGYQEITKAGVLRFPTFIRVREDK